MDKLRRFLSGDDGSPDEESGIMAQVIFHCFVANYYLHYFNFNIPCFSLVKIQRLVGRRG